MKRTEGEGRYQATREAFGFVTPTDGGADLYVVSGESAGALHGDRVAYVITRATAGRRGPEGTITAILERGFTTLTGLVAGSRRQFWLIPDHPRLPEHLRLVGDLTGVEQGQRLLGRLHDKRPGKAPGVLLERILGDGEDPTLDVEIVRTEFGLPEVFPAEALEEAARIAAAPEDLDTPALRDFTGEPVLTIDPRDARDFDDALSLTKTPDGLWLLRVHIADVAGGVALDGPLDREARRRGNSTYLPGQVIPMLPVMLSAGRMSLSPEERKRVVTVSIRLGKDGAPQGYRLDEGVIVSRARLTYSQVQQVLDGEASLGAGLDRSLRDLAQLARAVRRRRLRGGGFVLEVPETRVELDARGMPKKLERRLGNASHELIEEFMVLANRLACDYAVRRGHPYIYRVHPEPDPLRMEEFRRDLATIAPEVRGYDLLDHGSLRRFLARLPSEVRTWRIHGLLLRAFQRARYAAEDTGHFGLGLRAYGHFTSPIRRYPDLYNHRVVKWALRHGRRPVPTAYRGAAQIATEASATEERSERAERVLVRLKVLRWAQAHLGSSYRGTITSILTRGMFVELDDLPVDGFVPYSEIDSSAFLDRRPRLGSGRGGWQIGLPVIVQISRVDLRMRSLTFGLRASGRRAMTLDPERIDPVVDPWRARPGKGRPRPPRRREQGRGRRRRR